MEEHKVQFLNENVVFVDDRQYVSLRRFMENRSEIANEQRLIAEQNEKLLEENEHLKALLKELAVTYI